MNFNAYVALVDDNEDLWIYLIRFPATLTPDLQKLHRGMGLRGLLPNQEVIVAETLWDMPIIDPQSTLPESRCLPHGIRSGSLYFKPVKMEVTAELHADMMERRWNLIVSSQEAVPSFLESDMTPADWQKFCGVSWKQKLLQRFVKLQLQARMSEVAKNSLQWACELLQHQRESLEAEDDEPIEPTTHFGVLLGKKLSEAEKICEEQGYILYVTHHAGKATSVFPSLLTDKPYVAVATSAEHTILSIEDVRMP